MSLTKFVMQPTLHMHLLCGFKKYIHILILYNLVNMSDIVGCMTNFVNHLVYICNFMTYPFQVQSLVGTDKLKHIFFKEGTFGIN
jgi:hypothetical protein